jgi:hypothetical protein
MAPAPPSATAAAAPPAPSLPAAASTSTTIPNTGATYNTVGQPCHSTAFFVATISQWAVPPGCFATYHRWILVTEMNFIWRGGGFGTVDYRYVRVGPGVTFIYNG